MPTLTARRQGVISSERQSMPTHRRTRARARGVREAGRPLAPVTIEVRGRVPIHRRRSMREQCSHSLTYASAEYVIGHTMGAVPLCPIDVPSTVPFDPVKMT